MSNSGALPPGGVITPGDSNPSAALTAVSARLQAWDSGATSWAQLYTARSFADGNSGWDMLPALAVAMTDTNAIAKVRTPNVFKSATATAAGVTTLWTPTAGKKFRLMRYRIDVTNNASQAVAGTFFVRFTDSANDASIYHELFVPGAAGAVVGAYTTGWVDLGNGYLSLAANNVLQLSLQAALATGEVRASVCGNEE